MKRFERNPLSSRQLRISGRRAAGTCSAAKLLPISDPLVREMWRHFRHPARPVKPEEVNASAE